MFLMELAFSQSLCFGVCVRALFSHFLFLFFFLNYMICCGRCSKTGKKVNTALRSNSTQLIAEGHMLHSSLLLLEHGKWPVSGFSK